MKYLLLCFIMTGLFVQTGCDSAGSAEGYTYTAFDEAGDAVVRGQLNLDFEGSGTASGYPIKVTGTWQLSRVKDNAEVGPQVGTGTVEGTVNEKKEISLNFNPGVADNNILLVGQFADDLYGSFTGAWTYSTFIGPTEVGTFEVEVN